MHALYFYELSDGILWSFTAKYFTRSPHASPIGIVVGNWSVYALAYSRFDAVVTVTYHFSRVVAMLRLHFRHRLFVCQYWLNGQTSPVPIFGRSELNSKAQRERQRVWEGRPLVIAWRTTLQPLSFTSQSKMVAITQDLITYEGNKRRAFVVSFFCLRTNQRYLSTFRTSYHCIVFALALFSLLMYLCHRTFNAWLTSERMICFRSTRPLSKQTASYSFFPSLHNI